MSVFAALASMFVTLLGPAPDPECFELGRLDFARAQAFAEANVTVLRAVYADHSAASADERMFQRYASRGYRVVGAGLVRSRCQVVSRVADQVVLDVTETLAPAWAVAGSGEAHQLPRGAPVRRHISLTRVSGQWRIASVGEG